MNHPVPEKVGRILNYPVPDKVERILNHPVPRLGVNWITLYLRRLGEYWITLYLRRLGEYWITLYLGWEYSASPCTCEGWEVREVCEEKTDFKPRDEPLKKIEGDTFS